MKSKVNDKNQIPILKIKIFFLMTSFTNFTFVTLEDNSPSQMEYAYIKGTYIFNNRNNCC